MSAYAGGILDSIGRFTLRVVCPKCGRKEDDGSCREHQPEAAGAVVEARTSDRWIARKLHSTFGGRLTRKGWMVPAQDQERILGRCMPYLRHPDKVEACSKIIQFRMVQVQTHKVPLRIRKFRQYLAFSGED